ncbi:MAG: excinuclease ABC subunit UvrC [Spirochaetales bacterium]|nr:excinuclease ABC subunit UvrC [Spirochaetales bacterium]
MSRDELQKTIRDFPRSAGVYIMRDVDDTILYVGKAKSLHARVRSYFAKDLPIKTAVLMSRVARIDYLVTHNEYEALLLENELIKRHTPRYNINLKDGKSYPVIRITTDEYPRVFKTRRIVQDGSTYFGPFTSVWRLETYLDLIDRIYPLRKCRTTELKPRKAPCLYWHIGRCAAVCAGKTSREDYSARIESIKRLLSGKTAAIRKELAEQMDAASKALEFEKAAQYRDALTGLDQIESEQRVVDFDPEVRDYIGYAARDELCTFVVFQMRAGKLVGSNVFHAELPGTDEENLAEFVLQFYGSTSKAPRELYTSASMGDLATLQRFFREQLGSEVAIRTPETSRDASVLRLCIENARQELDRRLRERGDLPALEELAAVLSLPNPPLRIEGFDIAHVGGRNTVASLVSFSNGVPDKSQYKRFRIKSLKEGQIDDFAAMREVIARRYTRVKNERLPRPDLVLIDGGKGQVTAAREILEALELAIPVVGLAKRNEELFLPAHREPILLPEGSPPLRVLQHVRDEAHRFATTYRAGLQKKSALTPVLEKIPGIGPRRAAKILHSFPDIEGIIETPVDIIAKSTGISEEQAYTVQEFVRRELFGK